VPFLAVALPLDACGGGAEQSGKKFILRYHPPAGMQFRYEVVQEMKASVQGGGLVGSLLGFGGSGEFTLRMYVTSEVGEPVQGRVPLTTVVDSATFASPTLPRRMMEESVRRVRGRRSTTVFDDRMRFVAAGDMAASESRQPIPGQVSGGMRGLMFPFPDGPVGNGDSWTTQTEIPLGKLPTKPVVGRTTITIRDIREVGSDTTVRVAFETTFPSEPIQLEVEGGRGTLRLGGSLTGDQEFSMLLGATVSGTNGGEMRMTLSGAALGDTPANVTMSQRVTIRLLN
jgi:hypothetical protein